MRTTAVLAAGLATFLVSDVVAAQNLVANGDFDVGIASWTPGYFTVFEWSSADWQGDPTSGSGRLTNTADCAGTISFQCIVLPTPLAASYELGAAVWLESPPQEASARVSVLAWADPGCQRTWLGAFESGIVNQQGTWVSLYEPTIQLPASTQSVTIHLSVTKLPFLPHCLPPLPPATARFDNVRFGPTGTTPVTLQSLSIE